MRSRTSTALAAGLLAASGLAAVGAVSAATALPSGPVGSLQPSRAQATPCSASHDAARCAGTGPGTVAVSVPVVSFGTAPAVRSGRLRVPVLLADDTVTALVRVVGARTGPGCTAELRQGIPQQLDCSIAAGTGARPRLVVALSDGRTVVRSIAVR